MDQIDPSVSTAAKLAAEHSVSEATVKRAGKFAEEVAAKPELQNLLFAWSLRLRLEGVRILARLGLARPLVNLRRYLQTLLQSTPAQN